MLNKIFDPYERKARLYPVLLCLIPIVGIAVFVYGIEFNIKSTTISLLATLGVFYLAASLSRESGKKREIGLFAKWGGKPTTQILRHRNSIIDPITKERYHKYLSSQLSVTFPTPEEEDENPDVADSTYESATHWLREKTRDTKKFNLLFQENIGYGFRRNCLGIKYFGIGIAVLSAAYIIATYCIPNSGSFIQAISKIGINIWVSLGLNILMILIWIFGINEASVKSIAFSYADMLLRAIETLPKKRR